MKIVDLDGIDHYSHRLEDYPKIAVIEDVPVTIHTILRINDKHYSVCWINHNNIAGVHEIEYHPENKEEYDDDFKCPCCGFIDQDAWELEDNGDTECGRCGSKLSYEKHYSVTYTVELLEAPAVIDAEETK